MQINERTLPLGYALRSARKIIPVRGWDRIFRIVFDPEKQQQFEFSLAVPGGTIMADARSYLDWYALFYGSIEPVDLFTTQKILASIKARTVLDIGANVGHFAIAMAEFSQTVHAFEPNPGVFRRLIRNTSGLPVMSHEIGLSNCNADLRFQTVPLTNSGQGNFSDGGDITLPVRIGDEWLHERNISNVDFIKIDVEGMEREVLAGLRNTLSTNRPCILCEANGPLSEILALLPVGYECWTNAKRTILNRAKFVRLSSANTISEGSNIFFIPRGRVTFEKNPSARQHPPAQSQDRSV